MNEQQARDALDKAVEFYGDCAKDGVIIEEMCHAEEIVDDAIDAYAKESKLAVLAEILREGYTLEQVEDMRRNVEEGD